jgi:hypothetical protein
MLYLLSTILLIISITAITFMFKLKDGYIDKYVHMVTFVMLETTSPSIPYHPHCMAYPQRLPTSPSHDQITTLPFS